MRDDLLNQLKYTRNCVEILDEQIQYIARHHMTKGCNCRVSKCRWANMLENRKLYYELIESYKKDLDKYE